MDLNIDPEWLRSMAEKDNCGCISVGGLVTRIRQAEAGRPRKVCEACGFETENPYGKFDYCVVCGRVLCRTCMETGCCGQVPAESGTSREP